MADIPFKTIDLAKDRARLIAENKELRAKLSARDATIATRDKMYTGEVQKAAWLLHFLTTDREVPIEGHATDIAIEVIRRADATIAKLDKTADGVPMYLGMNCVTFDGMNNSVIRDDVGIIGLIGSGEFGTLVQLRSGDGDEWTAMDSEIFVTRAAAEAARGAEGKA